MAEPNIPRHLRLVYPPEQIQERVTELGLEIGQWAERVMRETKAQPLAVCVLRGAVLFFSDLLRAVPVSVEPTFCRAWGYAAATNKQLLDGVRVSVEDVEAQGRALLIVDDICDTGSTLFTLQKVFYELGAVEVQSAVLINRRVAGSKHSPRWSAFDYEGPEWFVGYGLEDKNWWRNLSAVYCMDPET